MLSSSQGWEREYRIIRAMLSSSQGWEREYRITKAVLSSSQEWEREYRITKAELIVCIKLIYFTIQVECCNFLNLYERYGFQHKTFLTIFSIQTQQIIVIFVCNDQKALTFRCKPIPLSFFASAHFIVRKTIRMNIEQAFLFNFGIKTRDLTKIKV